MYIVPVFKNINSRADASEVNIKSDVHGVFEVVIREVYARLWLIDSLDCFVKY
jgi:hypothetical protein